MRLFPVVIFALSVFAAIEGGYRTHIIEGKDAKHGQQPWIVSLQDNYGHVCGGSILRVPCMDEKNQSNIILTAAHCYWTSREYGYLVKECGNAEKNWALPIVLAGETDLTKEEEGQMNRSVDWVACHHGYVHGSHDNDIALVRLSEPLQFSKTIQPLELSESTELPPPDTECRLNGWGYITSEDMAARALHKLPPILQEVDIEVNPQCVHGTKMCAKRARAGKNTEEAASCEGDSGSPLICRLDDRFVQYGLVSHGDSGDRWCRKKFWATRVAPYIDWIQEQIEKLSCDDSS